MRVTMAPPVQEPGCTENHAQPTGYEPEASSANMKPKNKKNKKKK
jgi:hypothetical protein